MNELVTKDTNLENVLGANKKKQREAPCCVQLEIDETPWMMDSVYRSVDTSGRLIHLGSDTVYRSVDLLSDCPVGSYQ